MTRLRKERVEEIVRLLRRMYPKAACSLDFRTPFQLLVATILSAQSTDARVNMVTPHLFEKYPTVEAMASAQSYELEQVIHATGFFRNKAKSVIGAARAILERHGGQVPQTMEELLELPGVGRKTANVVLSNAFGKPVGMVVDTHVARVSVRLALTGQSDPVRIEEDLMALIPKKEWTSFAHRMILHGREICLARKPKCAECRLNEICPSAQEALN